LTGIVLVDGGEALDVEEPDAAAIHSHALVYLRAAYIHCSFRSLDDGSYSPSALRIVNERRAGHNDPHPLTDTKAHARITSCVDSDSAMRRSRAFIAAHTELAWPRVNPSIERDPFVTVHDPSTALMTYQLT
jgi:hypothetical protein